MSRIHVEYNVCQETGVFRLEVKEHFVVVTIGADQAREIALKAVCALPPAEREALIATLEATHHDIKRTMT